MKLKAIYDTAIKMGMAADPRGKAVIEKELAAKQKSYEKMQKNQDPDLRFFDVETLQNPYSDTRILFGKEDTEVNTVLMGVDMEVGELLLADRLKENGQPIDLVIAHHPEGSALAALSGVMHIHEDLMIKAGVLPNIAQGIMRDRVQEINRSIGVLNQQRSVNAAALLNQPFLCVHTPADNLVTQFIENHLAGRRLDKVGDVLDALEQIEEYATSAKQNNRPRAVAGDKNSYAGKILVDFTGGTSGAGENYKRLAEAGISTVIAMHCTEAHLKAAKEHYVNIIVASHLASDSIGCNLFLDALEQQGVTVIPVSGLIRVRRNGAKA